jgi:hypothetical protein
MRRIRLAFCLTALGLSLISALPALGAASPAISDTANGDAVRAVSHDALDALATKSNAADTQWYGDGIWHSSNEQIWFTAAGPATLAATLWRVNGQHDKKLFTESVRTFDRMIRAETRADGSFGGDSVGTEFFGVELGTTYLLLGNDLDPARRRSWRSAIAQAADYLIVHKDVTWEANGNINLGVTEFEWMAWAITGEQRFHDAFELAWKYTVAPPQARWPGYGLQITRPSRGAGKPGAGYLAENGGKGPGFDPEYSMLQLSIASRAFLLSNDPRFGHLASLLWNQLSPRVSRPDWTLDARSGSRSDHLEPFTSPGLAVLTTAGRRADLAPLAEAQMTTGMYTTYLGNAEQNWGSPGFYRGYGNELGVALLALATPPTHTGDGSTNAAMAGGSSTSASGSGAEAARGPRLRATVMETGVRVMWDGGQARVSSQGAFRLSIDGHLRAGHTPDSLVRLAPGLHQISLVDGDSAPTTVIVTVPRRGL